MGEIIVYRLLCRHIKRNILMKRVLIVFSVRLFSANANFVRMKLSFYKKKKIVLKFV